jgi:hypothetical protein
LHDASEIDALKRHGRNVAQYLRLDAPKAGTLPRVQHLLQALRHPRHHHIGQ